MPILVPDKLGDTKVVVLKEQEVLWKRYLASGTDSANRDVTLRNKIVEANIQIVKKVVANRRPNKQNWDDWVQIGQIALIEAVERFDPARKVHFSTYAAHCISGQILHHFRDHDPMIKSRKSGEANTLYRLMVKYWLEIHQAEPTNQQLAEFLGCSLKSVLTAQEARQSIEADSYDRALMLNGPSNYKLRTLLIDVLPSPVEQSEIDDDILWNVVYTVGQLPNVIWLKVIYYRYYEGLTQTETGKKIGYSQMHISRLEREALKWLRNCLSNQSLIAIQEQSNQEVERQKAESNPQWSDLDEFIRAAQRKKEDLGIVTYKTTGTVFIHRSQ